MSISIKAENLSKAYQLGQIGTGTISRDLERWWAGIRGKEDPFLKIGEVNDRTTVGQSDVVWSLKDISFEIEQGDAVGIIGRNGAGKSTLLKILSRVTAPTNGTIKAKGRIASLLEVGTGFHPELTGKENIYLNGAILGMRKKEIDKKLEQIIDFSGVDRYVDTPVKRYSSGMSVRLAFAVAAHLDSEILIVDEVLAVGDAEFQKKCLGKMGELSKGEGRTVLFVSHSINSIKRLCKSGILLKNGTIDCMGNINDVTSQYEAVSIEGTGQYNHIAGNQGIEIIAAKIVSHEFNEVKINDEMLVEIDYKINDPGKCSEITFFNIIYNGAGEAVIGSFQEDNNQLFGINELTGKVTLKLLANLAPGNYIFSVGIFDQSRNFIDWVDEVFCFSVEGYYSDGRKYFERLGLTVGSATWKG